MGRTRLRRYMEVEMSESSELVKTLDVRETNAAVRKLLEVTENPRHRRLLELYDRHRNLEIAGRYPEIFVPEMTVEEPVYHFGVYGTTFVLNGRKAVEAVYRMWTETNQCVFYSGGEQIAVADNFVASVSLLYQQTTGASLAEAGVDVDDVNAMYLYKNVQQMIWPYDDECRLVGEDVYEPDPSRAEIIKLDPADVLTAEESGRRLASLIKPLPTA
jgi:hypothetical protein